ncbi:MAG: long-chain fatty acid--CoA ligase [Chloroflexi bacterium]|nr:MAG: long-chain fatty acid--CoA ligase [Chloroflexota bacterium]
MLSRPWLKFYDPDVPAELTIPPWTVPDLLRNSARRYPKQTATVFMGARMSYARLLGQVDRLAAGLYSLGIRKGDRVAIMMPNCPQTIIAYYAVLSLGAVTVMTNPLYVARELEHQWGDAGVKMVLSLDLFWPQIQEVRTKLPVQYVILSGIQDYMPAFKKWLAPLALRRRGQWVSVRYSDTVLSWWRILARKYPAPPPVDLQPTDLACLQYTGGTTGLPKGAMLTHRNLIASICQIRTFLLAGHQDAEDRALAIMPFFHVYGMNGLMNLGVYLAATLILIPRPEIKTIVDAIQSERPTFFTGVPALYAALNNYRGIDRVDMSSIKAMFSGASPLPVEVMEQFEARVGTRIAEAYGLTEAASVTHVNPRRGRRKFGSIGVPIIGTDAKIVDVNNPDRELGVGEAGELLVKGPQVMQGYWNAADETARTLVDGWLRTGDIARMDEEGYFYIVDRKKDLILSAGYNVYPREVEEVLYQHPKVLEAAVVGLPDGLRGEKIAAFVTLKPGQTATAAEIRSFCRERLAPYKQPRLVVFREELPKTLAGKVLRRKLREEWLEREGKGRMRDEG